MLTINIKYLALFFLILFVSPTGFSQSHTITGVVSDDSNKPLESANVIAKPLREKASLKFAADNKGRYRLELDKEVAHEITVSYIGFVEEMLFLNHEVKEMEVLAEDCQTKAMNYIDNDYDKDGTHTQLENHDAYQSYLAGCNSKEVAISAN